MTMIIKWSASSFNASDDGLTYNNDNNFIHNFQLRTYLNTQNNNHSHCANLIVTLNNKNNNYYYKTLFTISFDQKEEHLHLVRKHKFN